MDPEPSPQEPSRGQEVEATLWDVVTRLRARGWRISLWEIQRAQDVIAYLFARLLRPPTDTELLRHLRPVLCATDGESTAFEEVFRQRAAAESHSDPTGPQKKRQRVRRRRVITTAAALVCAVVVLSVVRLGTGSTSQGHTNPLNVWSWYTSGTIWIRVGLALAVAATIIALVWSTYRKHLRRRSGPHDPGHDLELRWDIDHPLDTTECARTARALRTRSREEGSALDLRRTVDASIRSGMRLTLCFVQRQRSPEYLAVIEQRSAHDVLAAHHARIVDQISAEGVAIRRVGIHPRSRLVIDPVRGRRQLEALQPAGEAERLLLFAHDRALRDPVNGEERPWLSRFDNWADTTQIGPDVDQDRPLPVAHRALRDVRALDPAWAPARHNGHATSARTLPAVFDTGDELWIEACAPSNTEVTRALDLLITSLGPNGWYWLSACALYPEINYELTVSLGRMLRADDGKPVAAHLDIGVLAQLPWFRHAYMPDWLRTTLLSTLSHGQLADARTALHEILISGLPGTPGGDGSLSVAESQRAGRGSEPISPSHTEESTQDRVYLAASTLRRRRLAVTAPPQLVALVRERRHRLATATTPSESPSPRVRRALAWNNALLFVAALLSTTAFATLYGKAVIAGRSVAFIHEAELESWEGLIIIFSVFVNIVPGTVALIFSRMAGRLRGLITGASEMIFSSVLLFLLLGTNTNAPVITPAFVGIRLVTFLAILVALLRPIRGLVVPWAIFHRRCRRAFVLSSGFVLALTLGWTVIGNTVFPLKVDSDVIGPPVIVTLIISGTTFSTAAYFAGVRYVPLLTGIVLIAFGVGSALGNVADATLLFGLLSLLVLAGFYWQVQRATQHPPLDFWETRWSRWKWPLGMAPVGATMVITWSLQSAGEDPASPFLLSCLPAGILLINFVSDQISDRLAGALARFRLGSRFRLHFD